MKLKEMSLASELEELKETLSNAQMREHQLEQQVCFVSTP